MSFGDGSRPVMRTDECCRGLMLKPKCGKALLLDAGNLCAFDADTDHQAFLVEDEGIGIILERG